MESDIAKKKLRAELKVHKGSSLTIPNDRFEEWLKNIDLDAANLLLVKLRSEREFYKKILDEEYRKKNPSSFRYTDADKKLKIIRFQGPILNDYIKSKTN
jgi:hypothetical protein